MQRELVGGEQRLQIVGQLIDQCMGRRQEHDLLAARERAGDLEDADRRLAGAGRQYQHRRLAGQVKFTGNGLAVVAPNIRGLCGAKAQPTLPEIAIGSSGRGQARQRRLGDASSR